MCPFVHGVVSVLGCEISQWWTSRHSRAFGLWKIVIAREYHAVHVGKTAARREYTIGFGHSRVTDELEGTLDDLALEQGEHRRHLVRVPAMYTEMKSVNGKIRPLFQVLSLSAFYRSIYIYIYGNRISYRTLQRKIRFRFASLSLRCTEIVANLAQYEIENQRGLCVYINIYIGIYVCVLMGFYWLVLRASVSQAPARP